jgi:hypothetical protein
MTETDRALVFPEPLLPSFDIQEPKESPRYWLLCCRTCKLTWYLPKNPTRRTRDAISILATHADTHRENVSLRITEPHPAPPCAKCAAARTGLSSA